MDERVLIAAPVSTVKMLRTLWSRLGAGTRRPVLSSVSACRSQSAQYKPRTQSWILSSSFCLQQVDVKHALPALGGFKSTLLSHPANSGHGQKRFKSTDIVKAMLKPALKPAAIPAKRAPKGPRTKQPSRTNQPSQNEDEVIHSVI